MNMTKVIATNGGNIVVALPYNSNGAYGTWELPRSTDKEPATVLERTVGISSPVVVQGTKEQVLERGGNDVVATCTLKEKDPLKQGFHCSVDVTNYQYPGKKFPQYVQVQFVPIAKAVRMLKRSYSELVRKEFGIED